MHIERRLVPDYICFLILQPVVAVGSQAYIEVVHKFGENQARFRIGEAVRVAGVRLAGIS